MRPDTAPRRAAIALSGVVKDYRQRGGTSTRALDGFDLTVHHGEILGLLGRNGAGKSTVVKLACGLQRPSEGSVSILGQNPGVNRRGLYRRMGVVFGQKTALWWDLAVRDNLAAMRGVYGIGRAEHRRRRDELVGALSLGHVLDRPVRVLSLGERVKTELACSLLHGPDVVLLDEPTIGLDLVSKHQLRSYLRELVKRTGTAVLLTSHDTTDLTGTCDRLALLEAGHIVLAGPVDEVRRGLDDSVRVRITAGREPLTDDDATALRALGGGFDAGVVTVAEDLSTATIVVPVSRHQRAVEQIVGMGLGERGFLLEVAAATLEEALLTRFQAEQC
jgi:viologen exporter family transport system ATP-binding protein